MSSNHIKPNKRVLQIIDLLDSNSGNNRRVIFRFISWEEGSLYRLAASLKRMGYEINLEANRIHHSWTCIAEGWLRPGDEPLDTLCIRMVNLAEKFEVLFDGWETVIPGKKIPEHKSGT